MIDFAELKTSGIFRMWIEHDGVEYSYVGISRNIHNLIKSYIGTIKGYLRDTSTKTRAKFTRILSVGSIPGANGNMFRIAFFLVMHDIKMSEINAEVLEDFTWESDVEVQADVIKFIEKFNSEWRGFNGVTALEFKYMGFSIGGKITKEEHDKKLKLEHERQSKRILFSYKNNIKPMIWVFANYHKIPKWMGTEFTDEDYFQDGSSKYRDKNALLLSKQKEFQSLIDI